MSSPWVRPKQAPDDEVEVFGLGEPDAEDDTGDVLEDRYELLEVIACGATATVYRARDLATKSIVAVKVLYKGALEAVGEFFNQEARLAARIRSPHLVHASHFGDDDGRPFIVFDMVPGDALSELYSERLMPWRELCFVVLDLLAALAELHKRGITHRDVKPDNVFVLRTLGEQVHVTLLDLGFAAVPPSHRITGAPVPSRKVFGTFGFIAPELLAGALPEPRCDLYSVGALMYRMLTGQLVPDLRAAPDLICIPSPRIFVPTLPAEVDEVVMRALSDIDARFTSVAAMATAVRAAIAAAESTAGVVAVPASTLASATVPGASSAPPPAIPVEEEMRPFREAAALTVTKGEPLPEESRRQTMRRPADHERVRVRSTPSSRLRFMGIALGSGLVGAAVTWVLASGPREPTVVAVGSQGSASPTARAALSPVGPKPTPGTPPGPSTDQLERSTTSATHLAVPSTSLVESTTSATSLPQAASAVVAAISTPAASAANSSGGRSAARKKAPRHAETFGQAMTRLEPKIRDCARRAAVPEDPITVQIRSDPRHGVIDSVRVLRMSSQHAFVACADGVVRQAALPASTSPIEDFTFFKARGQAAK